MAFSNLEKAMAAVIGLDLARPGTTRAAAKQALAMVGRGAVRAAPAALRINPYAAAGLTGLAAYEAGLLDPLAQPAVQVVEAVDEAALQAPSALAWFAAVTYVCSPSTSSGCRMPKTYLSIWRSICTRMSLAINASIALPD